MKTTLLIATTLLAVAATTHAGTTMPTVQQQLQVESRDGKVLVTLHAHNTSAKPVYLPNTVYKSDRLFGRVFDIKDADTGAEIDYIGPMVKRGPYTKADYTALPPGAKHSHSIDISASYAFKPGKHNYQLSYAGAYLPDIARLDASATVPVPAIRFTHTAK